jgi:antirestriction protein
MEQETHAYLAFLRNNGYHRPNFREAREAFHDTYNGTWNSEEEFAEQLADDVFGVDPRGESDVVARYFDYEAFTHDLFMYDYYSLEAHDGGVHVFRSA